MGVREGERFCSHGMEQNQFKCRPLSNPGGRCEAEAEVAGGGTRLTAPRARQSNQQRVQCTARSHKESLTTSRSRWLSKGGQGAPRRENFNGGRRIAVGRQPWLALEALVCRMRSHKCVDTAWPGSQWEGWPLPYRSSGFRSELANHGGPGF